MSKELTLEKLVSELADHRGPDLRGYKHGTLERRIRKRMSEVGIGTYGEYLKKVRDEAHEIPALLNTILINVTQFFRDPQAWEFLRTQVLPKMVKNLRPGDSFRCWSAGCATGEEAFSLAILLTEQLGPAIADYDIKIYGTDLDEEALNMARRGEYPLERLRRVRSEWRDKYFQGSTKLRINREQRRLVIFGRSNLLSDAPISHCDLVLCRNLLIYFDAHSQKLIMQRLHYALEPGGVLFLGKAESKLTESRLFRPVNSRWRIFQRITKPDPQKHELARQEVEMSDYRSEDKIQQELNRLRLYQRHLMDTLKSGVIALDGNDTVTMHNDAALAVWGLSGMRLAGKKITNTELVVRCSELAARLDGTHKNHNQPVTFLANVKTSGEAHMLSIVVRPVLSDRGERTGTLIYTEDVSDREKLQSTVEQLEATSEELQSANEELETTNEELQSTNEELETTNEELQSTNEELETTNEELQSLNEELENMNEELERRTHELDTRKNRQAETLQSMPWPAILVDRTEKIQLWNSASQKLFGVGATSIVGVQLDRMPIEQDLRKALLRRARTVLEKNTPSVLSGQDFSTDGIAGTFDVHFTPVARNGTDIDGVLIMFGPLQPYSDGKAITAAPRQGNNNKHKTNNKRGNSHHGGGTVSAAARASKSASKSSRPSR
jgi:two-component system CheB/CheR fusion protein